MGSTTAHRLRPEADGDHLGDELRVVAGRNTPRRPLQETSTAAPPPGRSGRSAGVGHLPVRSGHSLSWPEPVIAHAKGIEMSQIQPRNTFASHRRVDLTESIHTRKEFF